MLAELTGSFVPYYNVYRTKSSYISRTTCCPINLHPISTDKRLEFPGGHWLISVLKSAFTDRVMYLPYKFRHLPLHLNFTSAQQTAARLNSDSARCMGQAVAQLVEALRHKPEVCGFPSGVTGIFHWHNPSGHAMALGSTQPLTEMSTRTIS
jgi:hypothetical protein